MLIVKVNGEKNLEAALKTLKFKVQKTGLIKELRERSEFVKPSDKRRKMKNKAKYVQKLKDSID